MKNKKTLMIIAAMLMICVVSIAGTLAYLTATTNQVKNTFVAGSLAKLVLDETDVELDNGVYKFKTPKDENRKTAIDYTVTPGVNIPKDPTVTVEDLEQSAYLFIEVIDKTPDTIKWEMDSNWKKLDGVEGKNKGQIYAYNTTINKKTGVTKQQFNVMNQDYAETGKSVKVKGDYAGAADETLVFYAYLCQAASFTDEKTAFTTCFPAP